MDVVSTLVAHFQPPEAVDPGAFVPPPTCICPVSRWSRCPAALCAGLCLSFSAPRGIWGSRSPLSAAASWGVSSADHGEACGSVRWRLQSPRGPWSRGRLQKCGSSRGGGLLGRPQRKALGALLSLICRIRAGLLPPPGGGYARRVQGRPLPVDLLCLAQPIQQDSVQLFPHARFVPFLEPTPAGHTRSAAHLLGQHLPGYAAL